MTYSQVIYYVSGKVGTQSLVFFLGVIPLHTHLLTCFYYHNHLFLRCPERDRLVAAWCFLKGDFCFLGQAGDTGINSWVTIHRWQDKSDMEMFSLKYQSRNGWWLISICSWNVVIHYNVFCSKENQILFKGEWEPVTEYIHMQIQLTLEQQGTRGTNDLHSWTSMYNLKKCTLSTLGFPTRELKVIKFCWGKRALFCWVSEDLVSTGIPSHFLVTMVCFLISEL